LSKHLGENYATNFGMGDGFIQCIGFVLTDIQYGCLVRTGMSSHGDKALPQK